MLFIDFSHLAITSERDVQRIKAEVERYVKLLGRKVYTIVNYNGCTIDPAVAETYARMVDVLVERFCLGLTQYGMDHLPRTAWEIA